MNAKLPTLVTALIAAGAPTLFQWLEDRNLSSQEMPSFEPIRLPVASSSLDASMVTKVTINWTTDDEIEVAPLQLNLQQFASDSRPLFVNRLHKNKPRDIDQS